MTPVGARRPTRTAGIPIWLLLLLLIGLGVSIRAVLGSVPVLNEEITSDLRLNATAFSLITSLTLLAMAVFAPLGHALATRIGYQWAVFWLLLVLAVGSIARLWVGSSPGMFASSLLCGAGMGGVSALAPGFISHTLARMRGTATGIFSLSMALGVAAAAAVALPAARQMGWRGSLALWGALALGIALLWLTLIPRLRRIPQPGEVAAHPTVTPAHSHAPAAEWPSDPPRPRRGVLGDLPLRDPTARLVTALSTLVLLTGFTGVAWIAPTMVAAGHSPATAAGYFGAFQIVQIASMLTLPVATDFTRDRRPLLAITTVTTAAGIALLLLDPVAFALPGVLLMGFGVGGASTLMLVLVQDVTTTTHDAGRLSGMSLLFSYLFGATGPLAIGFARDLTGSFASGLTILLAVTALTGVLVPRMRPGRLLAHGPRARPPREARQATA